MIWVYMAIHDAACIAACTVLVLNDCPWWAAMLCVFYATTAVQRIDKK